MMSLQKLSPRPPFPHRNSDLSDTESNYPMLPPSPSPSDFGADRFENVPLSRTQRGMRLAQSATQKTADVAKSALTYWPEIVFFSFASGVVIWLSVLSAKIRGLEIMPYCEDLPGYDASNPHFLNLGPEAGQTRQ